VLVFDREAVSLGEVLDRQVDLLREAHQRRDPVAATLLHHVAANGIEVERQLQSPPNAPAIMRLLLERGAEPDAVCDTYGGGRTQTTLYLLVSSCVPAAAGVQAALVEELCRGGAEADGLDDDGLPLWTAITFGYTEAAEALARCGARADNLVFHAALGDLAAVRELPAAHLLEYALITAAGHGRREVVRFLLGKQPDLRITEPSWGSTALGAAKHYGHAEIAALIEERLTPS
jgi:ankyrin repeat protein